EPNVTVEVDMRSPFCAGFGRDHNHTVSTSGTVYGTGRGIFQYFYRSNIPRVYIPHVVLRNPVDDIERVAGSGNGVQAPDFDVCWLARGAAALAYPHTGYFTGYAVFRVGNGMLLESIPLKSTD